MAPYRRFMEKDDFLKSQLNREIAACVFLLVCCVLAGLKYQRSFLWVFSKDVTFFPDLLSGLVAAGFMLFLHYRGYLLSPKGWLKYVNWALLFYMLAVFATIAIGKPGILSSGRSFLTILTTPTVLLPLIILGLACWKDDKFGLLALICLLSFGATNLLYASQTMGLAGFILAAAFALAATILIDVDKVKASWKNRPRSGH